MYRTATMARPSPAPSHTRSGICNPAVTIRTIRPPPSKLFPPWEKLRRFVVTSQSFNVASFLLDKKHSHVILA